MLDRTPKLLSINNYYYRRGGAEVLFLEQNRMLEEAGIGFTFPDDDAKGSKLTLSDNWQGTYFLLAVYGRSLSAREGPTTVEFAQAGIEIWERLLANARTTSDMQYLQRGGAIKCGESAGNSVAAPGYSYLMRRSVH